MALSQADLAHIAQVDPRLGQLMHYLDSQGHSFRITESLRDKERQRQLVDQGASKTMNSKHLTGNAIDIAMLDDQGKVTWDEAAYAPVGAAAKAYAAEQGWDDFTWGGDWGWDSVHFQTANAWKAAKEAGLSDEQAEKVAMDYGRAAADGSINARASGQGLPSQPAPVRAAASTGPAQQASLADDQPKEDRSGILGGLLDKRDTWRVNTRDALGLNEKQGDALGGGLQALGQVLMQGGFG
jgi:peptidoglycan L-alanyl-D-glutamate endopeptidase CwlK